MGASDILKGIEQTLTGTSKTLQNYQLLKERSEEYKQKKELKQTEYAGVWFKNTQSLQNKKDRIDAMSGEYGKKQLARLFPDMKWTPDAVKNLATDEVAESTPMIFEMLNDPKYEGKGHEAWVAIQKAAPNVDKTTLIMATRKALAMKSEFDKTFVNGQFNTPLGKASIDDVQNIKKNAVDQLNKIRENIGGYGGAILSDAFAAAASEKGYNANQIKTLQMMSMVPVGSKQGVNMIYQLQNMLVGGGGNTASTSAPNAEAPAAGKPIGTPRIPTGRSIVPLTREQRLKAEQSFRKEFTGHKMYGSYMSIAKAYGNIVSQAEMYESAEAQVAIINSFQRIIDEGATVREGDVHLLATAALPYSARAKRWLKRINEGELVPKDVLQNYIKIAKDMKDRMEGVYTETRNFYVDRGQEYGVSDKAFQSPITINIGKKAKELLNSKQVKKQKIVTLKDGRRAVKDKTGRYKVLRD